MKTPIPLLLTLSILASGCAASRPLGAVGLGAGGALIASELSGGNPGLTAAGAAGGVLLSEGVHYLARKGTAKAYASGYDKGRSDAVKQQYWLYVALQRDAQRAGQVRLYPVLLPEQRIDGVLFEPTIRNLRIEE